VLVLRARIVNHTRTVHSSTLECRPWLPIRVTSNTYDPSWDPAGERRQGRRKLPKVRNRPVDPPLDGIGPWSPSSQLAFGWRAVRAAVYGEPKQNRAVAI
jgi:hypothetical protein